MTPTSPYPYSHPKEIKIRTLYIVFPSSITSRRSYCFPEQILHILAAPLSGTKPRVDESLLDPFCLAQGESHISSFSPDTLSQSQTAEAPEILEPHSIPTEPTEASLTYTQISILITSYFSLPTLFYQLWSFIKPGLYLYEKRAWRSILFIFVFLSLCSTPIMHTWVPPAARQSFPSFETSSSPTKVGGLEIPPEAKIYTHSSLVPKLPFWSHPIFQFPTLIWIFIQFRILDKNFIIQKRKIRHVSPMIVAGIIAPPDLSSQILPFILMSVLYEILIFTIPLPDTP